MNAGMQSELTYQIQVEPVIFGALDQLSKDCAGFGIEPEHILRAVWSWADSKVSENPPQWLWLAIQERQQSLEAANTIEGEAGGV